MKSAVDHCNHALLVMSGKGGVGKSTITHAISNELSKTLVVLTIDVDLTSPSTPLLYGADDDLEEDAESGQWIAIETRSNEYLISLGLLLKKSTDAVIWRGPRKTSMIGEILRRTVLPNDKIPDIILVDTPPGTSDEHIAIVQMLKSNIQNISCLLVTTSSDLSIEDVGRQITFCNKLNLNIMGLLENMSNIQCKNCNCKISLFGENEGEELAKKANVKFMGQIPFESNKFLTTTDALFCTINDILNFVRL